MFSTDTLPIRQFLYIRWLLYGKISLSYLLKGDIEMTFWERVWRWFANFFANLGNVFVGSEDPEQEIVFSGLEKAIIVIFIVLISFFAIKFIGFVLKKLFGIKKKGIEVDISAKSFIISTIKGLLWVFVAFVIVNFVGIDIGSFAGLLSAITVALGLALQDLISAFASGLIIINSKNFVTNDYVKVDNGFGSIEGKVEKVHFFVTVLRTFDGQRVIVNNNNVIKSNLTNFSSLPYRRFNFAVTVAYDSDISLVKETINEILLSDPKIDKSETKPDVHIGEFGDYGIKIFVKAFTKNEDYWPTYNNLREKILIAFREKNIKMPITTITLVNENTTNE